MRFSSMELKQHEMKELSEWDNYMQSEKPLILLAGAQWCGPCNFLKPMLLNVSQEFED